MMRYSSSILEQAHDHCNDNRSEIANSDLCGCFYCGKKFSPTEIKEWVGVKDRAVCPKCGTDSVIGSASKLPIDDYAFLEDMHDHWFGHMIGRS